MSRSPTHLGNALYPRTPAQLVHSAAISPNADINSPAPFPLSQRYLPNQKEKQPSKKRTTAPAEKSKKSNKTAASSQGASSKSSQATGKRKPLTLIQTPTVPSFKTTPRIRSKHALGMRRASPGSQLESPYRQLGAECEVAAASQDEDLSVDVEGLSQLSQCSQASFTGSQSWVCGSQGRSSQRSSQFKVCRLVPKKLSCGILDDLVVFGRSPGVSCTAQMAHVKKMPLSNLRPVNSSQNEFLDHYAQWADQTFPPWQFYQANSWRLSSHYFECHPPPPPLPDITQYFKPRKPFVFCMSTCIFLKSLWTHTKSVLTQSDDEILPHHVQWRLKRIPVCHLWLNHDWAAGFADCIFHLHNKECWITWFLPRNRMEMAPKGQHRFHTWSSYPIWR